MAWVHGKNTFISLGGDDLSQYTSESELNQTAEAHDVTAYGKNSFVFEGGLKGGTASLSGTYDNTAGTGPKAVIQPLLGTTVELIRRPEGTGTGRPVDTVDVVVTGYVETSPVADMVKWSCELQLSDDVATTTQA
jgi:hypothetical protein